MTTDVRRLDVPCRDDIFDYYGFQHSLQVQFQVIVVLNEIDVAVWHILAAEFHASFLQAIGPVDVRRFGCHPDRHAFDPPHPVSSRFHGPMEA
jgi:hypothetical protein